MGIEQKAIIRITAEQAEALKLISDLQKQLQTDFRSIANDAKKMSGDVNGAMGAMGKATSAVGRAFDTLKSNVVLLAIAGIYAAVTALKKFTTDALEAEESTIRLKAQVESMGIVYADVEESINKTAKATAKYAHIQDEDARASLENLVFQTQDLVGAQENLNLVYDLAYRKNIDVSTATDAVAKAMTGNIEPLSRMFVELRQVNSEFGSMVTRVDKTTYAMKFLEERVGGAVKEMSVHKTIIANVSNAIVDYGQNLATFYIGILDKVEDTVLGYQRIIKETQEVDKANKIMAERLKATGEAYVVSQKEIEELIESVSEQTDKANISEAGKIKIIEKVIAAYKKENEVVGQTAKQKENSIIKIKALIESEIKNIGKLEKAEDTANKERLKAEEDYVDAVKKLESEKRKEILANQNVILKNLKETLSLAEKAYETYKAEVIRIQKEIKSTLAGDAEFLTSINRKFLSDSKKAYLERLDSERVLAEAKEAYAQGDLERAKELFETAKEGYKNLADYAESESTKFAGTNVKIKDEVVKGYTAAAEGLQDVLSAQSDLAESGMEDAAKLAADTQTKFDDLQNQIEELKRIDKEIEMEILVKGYEEALAKKAELEKATSSTHTIYTVYAGQNAPSDSTEPVQGLSRGGEVQPIKAAAGRYFSGYGGGDRIPILGEAGEYMMRKESVRAWGKGLFDMLNSVNPSAGILKMAGGGAVSTQAMDKLAVDLNLGGKTFGMTTDKSTGQDFAVQIKRLNILRGRYKQPY